MQIGLPSFLGSGTASRPRSRRAYEYVITFVSTLLAANLCFCLLNLRNSRAIQYQADELNHWPAPAGNKIADTSRARRDERGGMKPSCTPKEVELAGRTLDLTFFAWIRAADVCSSSVWSAFVAKVRLRRDLARLRQFGEAVTAPMIFSLSSCIIMWAWFFKPHRLPRNYNEWISSAAQVDERLVQALRECREGTFVYGKDTGRADLLRGMCRDLNYPEVWGDPAKAIPIPCELVHSGKGKSCEWHALTRFSRGWFFAIRTYLLLNLLIILRQRLTPKRIGRACVEASRSSAFLGGFIALFYYGVCLARTRAGPRIFSRETVTPQMMDGGICVGSGCLACGWSVLLEKPARRQEIAFFVAPRALATFFPRRYDRRHRWREQLAFSVSVAILLTTAQMQPGRIRGVFGRLLAEVTA